MARERMVTRTVNQTVAEVMTLNVVTCEVQLQSFTISGVLTGDELLKKLQTLYQTDELKLVHVNKSEVNEVLYGMTEDEFIRLSKVLPPRTGKAE